MSLSRRRMLTLVGGGTVLAAGAGTAGFLSTRTPTTALAPWAAAGGYEDPRMFALSYGILSPSPHNRQPWEVALADDSQIIVFRDKSRNLSETDPFDRQLTIGMGSFIEMTAIAATATGRRTQVDLFPEGEDGPVAVLTLSEGAALDPLFEAIPQRRSSKAPFEDRFVPAELIAQIAPLANIITKPDDVAALRQLTIDAWMLEATTYHTMKESVDLMRFGKAEIDANPDGLDMGGAFLEGMMALGVLTKESLLDPNSTSSQQAHKTYQKMLAATPAYAALVTPDNSRATQIGAGRQWARLNLTTTALGLALHPVSQCLQEFPEMAPYYTDVHAKLAEPGQTVQMLGRLGFGPTPHATPRWPLETRLKDA